MTDSRSPGGDSPGALPGSVELEPELTRLERKVLEAYAAPAPPRGTVDAVLAALFALGEGDDEPASQRRTDGLARR